MTGNFNLFSANMKTIGYEYFSVEHCKTLVRHLVTTSIQIMFSVHNDYSKAWELWVQFRDLNAITSLSFFGQEIYDIVVKLRQKMMSSDVSRTPSPQSQRPSKEDSIRGLDNQSANKSSDKVRPNLMFILFERPTNSRQQVIPKKKIYISEKIKKPFIIKSSEEELNSSDETNADLKK